MAQENRMKVDLVVKVVSSIVIVVFLSGGAWVMINDNSAIAKKALSGVEGLDTRVTRIEVVLDNKLSNIDSKLERLLKK